MGQKVLYIEDNPDNMLLVQRALMVRGYEIMSATDGTSGLRQVHRERPDLVLLDINLPDIDGYEVARRLRASEEFRHLPIIALTANALKGDSDKALAAGCDSYLAKPFAIRDLWDRVEETLAGVKA